MIIISDTVQCSAPDDQKPKPDSLNQIKAHIGSEIKFIVTGKDFMINYELLKP